MKTTRKHTAVELAAEALRTSYLALKDAQRKHEAAIDELERLKRKPKNQRIEYRLTMLNWSTDACGEQFLSADCDWHDTKVSALRDAKRRVEKGTTAVFVERIDLNANEETVAAVFGSIDAITKYGIADCPGGKKAIEAHLAQHHTA